MLLFEEITGITLLFWDNILKICIKKEKNNKVDQASTKHLKKISTEGNLNQCKSNMKNTGMFEKHKQKEVCRQSITNQ